MVFVPINKYLQFYSAGYCLILFCHVFCEFWLWFVPWKSESHAVMSESLWILQARILQWVASPFSRGSFPTQGSNPGLPTLQADSLPAEPPGKPKDTGVGSLCLLQQILLTQELNQGLPALQADSLPAELLGKPLELWVNSETMIKVVSLRQDFHLFLSGAWEVTGVCMAEAF